jgi:DNA-binding beta-propeller fold protein YncE
MRIVTIGLVLAFSGSAVGLDSPPVFVATWGTSGSAPGQFNTPWNITLAGDGSILVADTGNHRIQRFNEDGVFLDMWGSQGSGAGQFYFPHGIAVDESSQVYVADWGNNRIQKLDAGGNFILQWGTYGAGQGQFAYPWGVAVHAGGLVYVTDQDNHRVQAFQRDGSFALTWGSRCEISHGTCGEGNGLFYAPRDITIDTAGNAYVVDSGNNRVQKFGSEGNFLTKWGYWYFGDAQLSDPTGICSDNLGAVYVDATWFEIKKFDLSGNLLTMWGSQGSAPGQLSGITDIAASESGAVYVLEGGNRRVSKFSTSTSSTEPWAGLETLTLLPGMNPARGRAHMRLFLPWPASVLARVFDARGRLIQNAFSGALPAGTQPLLWDGTDHNGRAVQSGVFYVVVESEGARSSCRVVLIE